MLYFGGGVLAAGLTACGPSAEDAARARAALRAPAPASDLNGAVPHPTATTTPSPELRLNIIPHALTIPRVGLDVPVEPAAVTGRGIISRPEIVVPNYGVVSPNLNLGRNSVNNIWILGHSRWAGERQPMFRLSAVRKGDLITVAGFERTRRQDLPALEFVAERLVIADTESATNEIYQSPRAVPRLVMQTSARVTGERLWILDRPTLEPHVEYVVRGDRDDPALYLVLLVFAALTPDSLAYLRRPPRDESAIT